MPLPQSEIESLRDQVRQMMSAEGLSLDELATSASDVVVFGSRAAGVHRPDSDLDLLVVSGRSGHKKTGKLDLVFVPETRVDCPVWRRTEIARHIGAFGVSLMHNDVLVHAITDEYAATRKRARLQKLGKSLLSCWHTLNDELRLKYLTRVRRELQRYRYLEEGLPVPPTANLDSIMNSPDWIERAFRDVGDAANMPKSDAVRLYQLMTNEADRICRLTKGTKTRRRKRAA